MATQSLYRRYRPRRFSEIKGQQHVVKALRDAVAGGREGQAYLFSGPRGTGKTTSARILAKVLNCENVQDGEPCCECPSCLSVELGTSYDVHELDAASNNGVEAIRDLIEKASLGTPGRHRVYILDEVHMLSKGAEAALLKTLEEPPPHVVFVLATTDPQKMSDTIRSRTQHLQFHLLPSDELSQHVRWVAADAGLELSDEAFDSALARGGGSARDTLSALELLVATGGEVGDDADMDAFLSALINHDPGAALTAMASAVGLGLDPRAITEELVRHLRNGFLSLMAPDLVIMAPERLDQLSDQARQFGAAGLVKAIERLGTTLTDMRNAPDPRVLVEVALVQLTGASTVGGGPPPNTTTDGSAATDMAALAQRIATLEARLEQVANADPAGGSASSTPLGGAAARARAIAAKASQRGKSEGGKSGAEPTRAPSESSSVHSQSASSEVTAKAAVAAWDEVRTSLKPMARALFSAGDLIAVGDRCQFVVVTEAQAAKCNESRPAVEQALSAAVGATVSIEVTTQASSSRPPEPTRSSDVTSSASAPSAAKAPSTASASPATARDVVSNPTTTMNDGAVAGNNAELNGVDGDSSQMDEETYDPNELVDAPPESIKTPLDQLAEAFPGSEMIEE